MCVCDSLLMRVWPGSGQFRGSTTELEGHRDRPGGDPGGHVHGHHVGHPPHAR